MLATLAVSAFAAAGLAWLWATTLRDHRAALARRTGLLDGVLPHVAQRRIEIAPDGFPRLTGRLPDRREILIELIPDTMVMRRLPQLWLCVTLRERVERPRASIGALARPTGAEFYSRVHDFPERINTPPELECECIMRGDGRLAAPELGRVVAALGSVPGRQADQGSRGNPARRAHHPASG
jgi:hypothetical protein